jgi:hypothetical protein
MAAGIARVKSAKSIGVRSGNWCTLKQAQALLNAPDIATNRGAARPRHHRRAAWLIFYTLRFKVAVTS